MEILGRPEDRGDIPLRDAVVLDVEKPDAGAGLRNIPGDRAPCFIAAGGKRTKVDDGDFREIEWFHGR